MDIVNLVIAETPIFISIVIMILRYENRLTRIETKLDILLPKKEIK
jgi:hypothetical protein